MRTRPTPLARLRGAICAAGVACAVFLALVGTTGALFTDASRFTQYLFWVPGALLWPAVLACAATGIGAARSPRFGWRGRAPRASVTVCVVCVVAAGLGMMREWRVTAVLRPGPTEAASTMRVFHWNMTSNHSAISERPVTEIPGVGKPDLVLLSTTQPMKRFRKSAAPLEGYDLRRIGMFSVASRYRIMTALQRRILSAEQAKALGIDRRPPAWAVRLFNSVARDAGASHRDFDDIDLGTITFLRLDTRALFGRSTVVWFIDLPSNPLVSRSRLAGVARSQLRSLAAEADAGDAGSMPGLGEPDLIIGDLNIPARAASISRLAPGFRTASAVAAPGRLASWPRRFPLWHLDHALTGPHARATDYRLIQTDDSEHLAQLVTLTVEQVGSGLAEGDAESDNIVPDTRFPKEPEE